MSENYIQISKLNDFVFCPYSLYLHTIYEQLGRSQYQKVDQTRGTLAHVSIDKQQYASGKRFWQATPVYSERLGVVGKIDLFDSQLGTLIERKYKIKTIYPGYKWQLYAQYFCLQERSIQVNKICLHSLSDNKRYFLPLPTDVEFQALQNQIARMRNFDFSIHSNPQKCQQCIYATLCDQRNDI